MPKRADLKEDYELDLQIDPDALDAEWLQQPMIFMQWSELFADAKAKVDRGKIKLDVVEAEVATDVRHNPEKYGLEKITEAAVRTSVLQSESYQQAAQELINLRHTADILGAAVRSFEQRKVALENLVKLQGQNYFAAPSEPRDLPHEFTQHKAKRAVAVKKIKERRAQRRKQ